MDFVNLLALSIPILIGYLILLLLLPNYSDGRVRIGYLWKLFLAPGIGFALVSCIYFLWSVIFTPDRAIIGLLFIDSILVVLLTLTLYFSRKRMKGSDPNYTQKKTSNHQSDNYSRDAGFHHRSNEFLGCLAKGILPNPIWRLGRLGNLESASWLHRLWR